MKTEALYGAGLEEKGGKVADSRDSSGAKGGRGRWKEGGVGRGTGPY